MKTGTIKICAVLLFVTSSLLLSGCSAILDGPFNRDGVMVPELLYANNGSDYITYWDEDTRSYRTYDQKHNIHLENAVYSLNRIPGRAGASDRPGRRSQNYVVSGPVVMPMTHLDRDGIEIQRTAGCKGCHQT